jgi:preprotein translocase subunit YajC
MPDLTCFNPNEIILLLGAAPPPEGGGGGLAGMFLPMILIFVIFYFLLIRPQQKKAREHQDFLNALEKGNEVVTSGGVIGKITGLTNTVVTLEVAPKVRVKVTRSSIAGKAPKTGSDESD